MARYQLLLGSHIDRDPKVARLENETSEEFDRRSLRYHYWNSPDNCIVDTEEDLEKRYNKPGFEKFRKITDFVVAKPQELDDTVFMEEAIRRGFPREVVEKLREQRRAGGNVTATEPPTQAPLEPSAVANNREQKVKDALANLNKMSKQGLEQLAADEEIDLSGCKSDEQMRQAIRKHFGK